MIYLLKSQVVENRRYTNINLKNDFVNVVEIFFRQDSSVWHVNFKNDLFIKKQWVYLQTEL